MKTKLFAATLGGLLLGVIIGATITTSQKRAALSDNSAAKTELFSLLPSGEDIAKAEWNEYRKSDWHVGVVWVNDLSKKESRAYAFRKTVNGGWEKLDDARLSYEKDSFNRLNHVDITYPDRTAMLINDQGLLIRTMLLGDGGDQRAEAK
jgi:hypothetical protein